MAERTHKNVYADAQSRIAQLMEAIEAERMDMPDCRKATARDAAVALRLEQLLTTALEHARDAYADRNPLAKTINH